MRIKVHVVAEESPYVLAPHVASILNNPQIEVLDVHYCSNGFVTAAFIHYRENERCEMEDEKIHNNHRGRL